MEGDKGVVWSLEEVTTYRNQTIERHRQLLFQRAKKEIETIDKKYKENGIKEQLSSEVLKGVRILSGSEHEVEKANIAKVVARHKQFSISLESPKCLFIAAFHDERDITKNEEGVEVSRIDYRTIFRNLCETHKPLAGCYDDKSCFKVVKNEESLKSETESFLRSLTTDEVAYCMIIICGHGFHQTLALSDGNVCTKKYTEHVAKYKKEHVSDTILMHLLYGICFGHTHGTNIPDESILILHFTDNESKYTLFLTDGPVQIHRQLRNHFRDRQEHIDGKTIDNMDNRVRYFYDRNESWRLKQNMQEEGTALLLLGPPGSGKTQLVLHYVEYLRSLRNPKYVVLWRLCEHNAAELKELAKRLGTEPGIMGSIDDLQDRLQVIEALLRAIFDELSSRKYYYLMVFDNINDLAVLRIAKQTFDEFKGRSHGKVIFASTNMNLTSFLPKVIEVNGFNESETKSFFYAGTDLWKIDEDEIIKLAKQFDFLALGLAAARGYLIRNKTTVENYLTKLTDPETAKLVGMLESGDVDSYDSSLLQALQKKLENIFKNDPALQMFRMACVFNNSDIPLSLISTCIPVADKEETEDLLISWLHQLSLGSVSEKHSMRFLTMHRSVQHAARLMWSDDQRIEATEQALFVLLKYFDKDIRFNMKFKTNILVPHVVAALDNTKSFLKHESFKGYDDVRKKAVIARILLYDVLGYDYSQGGYNADSEESLRLAKTMLFSLADINDEDDAGAVYCKLSEMSDSLAGTGIMSFVLNRNLTDQDVGVIKSRLPSNLSVSNQLSHEDYDQLVEYGAAIDETTLRKMFLPAVMVSVLYSFSRSYFYQKDKCDPDKKSAFVKDMQMTYDLSRIIYDKTGYHLIHEMLSQRNALLYLNLEKKDNQGNFKSKVDFENVSKACQAYEKLAIDDNDYYQFGILKVCKGDTYGKMVCLRQILECYRKLHEIDPHKEMVQETPNRVEKMLMLAKELTNKSTYLPNIYNTAAEIELIPKTEKGRQMAVYYYEKSIAFQKDVGQRNYVLLDALLGIANVKVILAKGDSSSAMVHQAKTHLEEVKELAQEMWLHGNETESSDTKKKVMDILKKINDMPEAV